MAETPELWLAAFRLLAAYGRRLHALRQPDRFELAIVYAKLLPFLPGWLERQLLQIPFLYNCDDAFFLKYRSGRLRLLQPLLGDKAERLMAAAVAVTAGNTGLATHARSLNSTVTVLPSVVDTDQFRQPRSCRLNVQPTPSPWAGSAAPPPRPICISLWCPCCSWPANASCACLRWAAPPQRSLAWR